MNHYIEDRSKEILGVLKRSPSLSNITSRLQKLVKLRYLSNTSQNAADAMGLAHKRVADRL
jgi:hypothetical protein